MGIGVSVKVDLTPALSRLSGNGKADAIEALSREVEADIEPYVKRDTGTLAGSPEIASDYRAGRIVWTAQDGGEYAGYAYDDPNVGDHEGQNPKATARWIEAAKRELMDSWTRLAASLFSGGAR